MQCQHASRRLPSPSGRTSCLGRFAHASRVARPRRQSGGASSNLACLPSPPAPSPSLSLPPPRQMWHDVVQRVRPAAGKDDGRTAAVFARRDHRPRRRGGRGTRGGGGGRGRCWGAPAVALASGEAVATAVPACHADARAGPRANFACPPPHPLPLPLPALLSFALSPSPIKFSPINAPPCPSPFLTPPTRHLERLPSHNRRCSSGAAP